MSSKPMKRWFISLVFREVQSKTTMSHHNIHFKRLKLKRPKIPTVGKDIEHLELSYIAGGMETENATTALKNNWADS